MNVKFVSATIRKSLKCALLYSQLACLAQIDPFGWNAVRAKQLWFLTLWKFLWAFAALAHFPVNVAFGAFINGSLELVAARSTGAFDESGSTFVINERMHAGRWTHWLVGHHNLWNFSWNYCGYRCGCYLHVLYLPCFSSQSSISALSHCCWDSLLTSRTCTVARRRRCLLDMWI